MRALLLSVLASLILASCALPSPSPQAPAPSSGDPGPAGPGPSAPPEEIPPPVAGPDAVDAALAEFREYMHSGPEARGVCRQIRRLGALGDPRVAAELLPLLDGKHLEVRIAAANWIGRQGDPAIADHLVHMAGLPRVKKEPAHLAAVLAGIGDADAAGKQDRLLRIAREWADEDAGVAAAGYRAAARVVEPETVGALVKDLAAAAERAAAGPAESRERAPRVAAARVDVLQRLTGESFGDADAWSRWWKDHRRNWTPRGKVRPRMEPLRVEALEGEPLGFALERPGPDWVIHDHRDGQPRAVVSLVAPPGGEAWVALSIFDEKTFAMKSAEAWAAEALAAEERAYPLRREIPAGSLAATPRFVKRGKRIYLLTTVHGPGLPRDRREEMERIHETFLIVR